MIAPQNKSGDFFIVSNRIFDFKLKPRDFTVYCCLVKHSDINGVCFPSRRLMAVRNLEETGLLKKEQRRRKDGTNTSSLYKLDLLR